MAANLVNRDFCPSRKHETWTADITYVATDEGWLALAAVEGLFKRQIVGGSMSERIDSRPAVDPLKLALIRQRPGSGLTVYSDRGVQCASEDYQRLLKEQGITCLMSRKGNCLDNAPMESFLATLMKELVRDEQYGTRAAARRRFFESVEVFDNRQRRHSALGDHSPAQFADAA
jgi:putative transposase